MSKIVRGISFLKEENLLPFGVVLIKFTLEQHITDFIRNNLQTALKIEIPNGRKYVHAEVGRTRGVSRVHYYIV